MSGVLNDMKRLITLFAIFLLHLPFNGWTSSFAFKSLSLEEKIGQLMIVHFNGHQLNQDAQQLIREAHVGGFIYYQWANGLEEIEQVKALSNQLQAYAKQHSLPLLVGIDQEGGIVTRLKNQFTVFPGNGVLGLIKDLPLVKDCAYAMGREMAAVGINLNFAPVVDVKNASTNVIGMRSFGPCPLEVTNYAKQTLAGYHQAGIMTTLKHFPGYGQSSLDAHVSLPVIELSKTELDQIAWLPFRTLASEADVIMTGHLLVPALDTECVTFSRHIVENVLRGEIGFQGVVMTDSLVMQGLLDQESDLCKAALRSLQAGYDILLLGGKQLNHNQQGFELTVQDVLTIHRYLVEAVRTGHLREEQIDQSVARVLDLKQKYHLFENSGLPILTLEEWAANRELAQSTLEKGMALMESSHE